MLYGFWWLCSALRCLQQFVCIHIRSSMHRVAMDATFLLLSQCSSDVIVCMHCWFAFWNYRIDSRANSISIRVRLADCALCGSQWSLPAACNMSGVDAWTRQQVCDWLRSCGLDCCSDVFLAQHIDGAALLDLDDADLREMQVTIGKRKAFLRHRRQLVQHSSTHGEPDSPAAVRPAAGSPEAARAAENPAARATVSPASAIVTESTAGSPAARAAVSPVSARRMPASLAATAAADDSPAGMPAESPAARAAASPAGRPAVSPGSVDSAFDRHMGSSCAATPELGLHDQIGDFTIGDDEDFRDACRRFLQSPDNRSSTARARDFRLPEEDGHGSLATCFGFSKIMYCRDEEANMLVVVCQSARPMLMFQGTHIATATAHALQRRVPNMAPIAPGAKWV